MKLYGTEVSLLPFRGILHDTLEWGDRNRTYCSPPRV